MKQPKGFEAKGQEDCIWELQKGLYGLPQAGKIWNKAMNLTLSALLESSAGTACTSVKPIPALFSLAYMLMISS